METLFSADGTAIAFERMGEGEALILIGGASCDAARMHPTAERLGRHFEVLNYDRRGRGGSGDTAPYAIDREIEDVGALIAAAGGRASVYGHSSGAGLALHAAASGLSIDELIMHDPPYGPPGGEMERESRAYGERLATILADGRRGDAAELFMSTVGMPQKAIDEMRRGPGWPAMERLAPTLAYDSEVMGDVRTGGTVPVDLVEAATPPALVVVGEKSPPFMLETGARIADLLPDGRFRVLEGQDHVVDPEALAPVLVEFLAR